MTHGRSHCFTHYSFICSSIFLLQPFATAPYVFVTPDHHEINKHDAASVWAEDVTTYNFRACLRELKNFDGEHKYLSVVSSWGFYTQIFGDLLKKKKQSIHI